MNQPKKRRIVLIDHRFQLRMAAAFIALQVLLTAIFAFGLYLFMDSEIHADLASAHASYLSLSQMLLPIVSILAVFSVTLSIVLATGFVVLISHKIAGPMYRFRTVLEALANRRFESFRNIRPDDQLGELAVSVDKAVSAVKTDVGQMKTILARVKASHAGGDAAAVASALGELDNVLNAWQESAAKQGGE